MVDVRDIADVAVAEFLERHNSEYLLTARTLELVGLEAITGQMAARILGRRN